MRKGEELKAPRYASAAVIHDYITARDIILNSCFLFNILYYLYIFLYNSTPRSKKEIKKYKRIYNKEFYILLK